jgi:hypothetical protein
VDLILLGSAELKDKLSHKEDTWDFFVLVSSSSRLSSVVRELVREDAPHFALRDRTFVHTVLFRAIICHHEALAGAHCPSLSSPFHDNL